MSFRLLSSILFFMMVSCSNEKAQEEEPNLSETENFLFRWKEGEATLDEIERARALAEEVHLAYESFFGDENMPRNKTVVNLGGDAFADNPQNPKIPFVDENGEIFLYRFATGYLGEFPHEYVHVLRLFKGWSSDGFLEEGLAEAISFELFPNNIGFSLYGYSTTVAAGFWFENDNLIPLNTLKDKHFDVNLSCSAQSYSIRADFFQFLLTTYGKQEFMSFLYAPEAGTNSGYELFFGKDFETLEQEWLQNLELRLNSLADRETLTLEYGAKINELNFNICQAGADF